MLPIVENVLLRIVTPAHPVTLILLVRVISRLPNGIEMHPFQCIILTPRGKPQVYEILQGSGSGYTQKIILVTSHEKEANPETTEVLLDPIGQPV